MNIINIVVVQTRELMLYGSSVNVIVKTGVMKIMHIERASSYSPNLSI